LFSELLLSDLLLLHLVDGFDEHTLVLEEVTLGSEVEMMVAISKGDETTFFWTNISYISLEIFLASLYFLRSLLRTLCLLIHKTFWGILASLVPFLLP
jgi:hypothetical protein